MVQFAFNPTKSIWSCYDNSHMIDLNLELCKQLGKEVSRFLMVCPIFSDQENNIA